MNKILIAAAVLALSACGHLEDVSPPTNVNAEVNKGGVIKGTDTAVVRISVGDNGMPKVLVDPIIVTEGQRVVWAGPETMTIRFPKETPFEKNSLETQNGVVNAVVPRLESEEKQQEYKYDVIVKGVVLDPVMIVRKRF